MRSFCATLYIKTCCPCGESNHHTFTVHSVGQLLHGLQHADFCFNKHFSGMRNRDLLRHCHESVNPGRHQLAKSD